jgi:hypothetical protein
MPDYGTSVESSTIEVLQAQARRSSVFCLKKRARHFATHPMTLEGLYPGLSAATPETMIAIASHLLDTEAHMQRRWFGFGGELCALNAKAALLYGRVLRRLAKSRGWDRLDPNP